MAAKRKSRTQKLQEELNNYKQWLKESEERVDKFREQAENSFVNSPTFRQMEEKISFLESCNKLSEGHLKSAKGSANRLDHAVQQVYGDNKKLMAEHTEDTDYFIGITENWHEAWEYEKLRNEILTLQGRLDATTTLLSDRDTEIERLQGVVGELRNEREPEDALYEEINSLKEENSSLRYQVEELKCQLSQNSSATLPSDDSRMKELEYELADKKRCLEELMDKISELQAGQTTSYSMTDKEQKLWNENKELSKQLEATKTRLSTANLKLRQVRTELDREQKKKYDIYVEEDKLDYIQMEKERGYYKELCRLQEQNIKRMENHIAELEQQVTKLTTTAPSSEESVAIIEHNIEQHKELKKATQKKQGRPSTIDERTIALMIELKSKGHSQRDIASQVGCSVGTVNRLLKQNQE